MGIEIIGKEGLCLSTTYELAVLSEVVHVHLIFIIISFFQAKEHCNGLELDGRKIRVDYSITKRAHTPTPGVYMGKPTKSSYDERDRDRDRGRYDDRDDYHDRGKEEEREREVQLWQVMIDKIFSDTSNMSSSLSTDINQLILMPHSIVYIFHHSHLCALYVHLVM